MSLFRRLFFNLWYFRRPPWDTGITPPEVMDFLANRPPGRALDLGCGTGTNAITLAQHGWQTTGVDFVARAVKAGRRKARQSGVEVDLRTGDVTDLSDLSSPYDFILDIGCYHGVIPDRRRLYHQNVRRLLAPDGTLLIYAFFKTAPGDLSGIEESDLTAFEDYLTLADREDSDDSRGRPSTWLTYTTPTK